LSHIKTADQINLLNKLQ